MNYKFGIVRVQQWIKIPRKPAFMRIVYKRLPSSADTGTGSAGIDLL